MGYVKKREKVEPNDPEIVRLFKNRDRYLDRLERKLEALRSKCNHEFVVVSHFDDWDGWSHVVVTYVTFSECVKCGEKRRDEVEVSK